MPAQTANNVTVPVGSDGWKITDHIKQAFESAVIPISVSSATERDGLAAKFPGGVLPNPTMVMRMDLAGSPTETWDGATWSGWTQYTPEWGGWVDLGSGAVSTGSYLMIGPKLCTVRMKLTAGAGGLLGTGAVAVTLPFTSESDQATLGQGEWLGSGASGGIQNLILSNPASNNQASILSPGSGAGIAVTPGDAGYGYGADTEVHATITYRTA